eukprot:TRINITY_DN2492_c0_g1_i3.p1 TRINITY_DN2492_c0_g1~~TRINITY_DN2492_c0_g1_i3.p1  ORF type:complete len:129 (-),score=16.16 TRINITY_DN2492_c0_g1_i3:31-417(-)
MIFSGIDKTRYYFQVDMMDYPKERYYFFMNPDSGHRCVVFLLKDPYSETSSSTTQQEQQTSSSEVELEVTFLQNNEPEDLSRQKTIARMRRQDMYAIGTIVCGFLLLWTVVKMLDRRQRESRARLEEE